MPETPANPPGSSVGAPLPGSPTHPSPLTAHPVSAVDLVIIGAGVFAMAFSFFRYYTSTTSVRISGLGFSASRTESASAWHGFFGGFATSLAFAAAGLLAVILTAKPQAPTRVRMAVLVGFGISALCTLLALVVGPAGAAAVSTFGVTVDKGNGIGYWLSLLVIVVGTGLSYLRVRQAGGVKFGRAVGLRRGSRLAKW